MITGFNTDVKHNAKVYHVQTEDKGRENPKIETLVYVGGEILDNYRTSYEQDKSTLGEDEIMELLENQHKRVIRSIKVGKYDKPEPFDETLITDRSFDEIIITYLETEPATDQLKVVTNGLATLFKTRTGKLQIDAKKAGSGEPVPGANIRVKLTAPKHRTILLDSGVSNEEGSFIAHAKLPAGSVPDAALVIQAISEWGAAEQKYPLQL